MPSFPAVFLLAAAIGAGGGPAAARPSSTTANDSHGAAPAAKNASPANAKEKRLEECRSKLKLAADLKLLYDLDWKSPEEPYVVVGPTFYDVPIDVKEGVAQTVSCFVNAGDTEHRVPFDLLDWKTGKPIARFSRGKLSVY